MELKPDFAAILAELEKSLNRTFYGIETSSVGSSVGRCFVLIVPFMELKQLRKHSRLGG
jgi:hypothetical protein